LHYCYDNYVVCFMLFVVTAYRLQTELSDKTSEKLTRHALQWKACDHMIQTIPKRFLKYHIRCFSTYRASDVHGVKLLTDSSYCSHTYSPYALVFITNASVRQMSY